MSYNGSGTFNINTAGQPVVTGTVISSTAFNALTADLATGLSTAITKNGQTTVTANIPFNNFKLTGIGVATATGDALSYGQAATVTSLVASTSITDSGLTSGRLTYASTGGLLADSASLTWDGSYLTAASIKDTALTSGRVTYAGASGLLQDSANLTFNGTTLTAAGFSGPLNGTVGATTPSTGAFTTLSATKPTTIGDVITFTSGAASSKTGYLYVNTTSVALSGAPNGGSGMCNISLSATGLTLYGPDQTKTAVLDNTGLAVTGTLSATTSLAVGSGNSALKIDALGANNFEIYNGALTADGTNYAFAQNYTGANTQVNAASGGQVLLQIAGATKATLDSSGNLGLGVTPSAASVKTFEIGTIGNGIENRAAAITGLTQNAYVNTTFKYAVTGRPSSAFELDTGAFYWYTAASGTAGNNISFTQAMTLDASKNLLVGTATNAINDSNSVVIVSYNGSVVGQVICNHLTGTGTGEKFANFGYAGSSIGSIAQTGTTAVLYNTTSDYRLKTNQQPLTGSGAFIDALQPKSWEWIGDGRKDAGFIAHEFQVVCPNAVTGVKDETEEQEYEVSPAVEATETEQAISAVMGTRTVPKYQAMQASSAEVIANMVAELQSLRKRITALENK